MERGKSWFHRAEAVNGESTTDLGYILKKKEVKGGATLS